MTPDANRLTRPEARPAPRNNLPVRRIHALLLGLVVLLLCDVAAGWLIWRHQTGGHLAWAVEIALAVASVALVAALFAVNRKALVEPIRGIAEWASHIRQGNFSARLEAGQTGLYGLTDDINRLAEWLESLAESKNRELLEQAARLKTQTHLVRLLYDISGNFSHNAGAAELMERSAAPMAEVLEARRVEFFRFDGGGDGHQPVRVAEAGVAGPAAAGGLRCVKIPLRFSAKDYGECRVWFAAGRFPLPDEFSQLLYNLGRNIAMALERIDLHAESARLSRMRERTHLANELHDSLAQTIAGLRFQARALGDALRQRDQQAAWEQMEALENLLAEANAELLSLIRYFRAPIDPGGLRPAIQSVVDRFRGQCGISLFFQDQWSEVEIPEKWRLEIVRIIQEALTNIRKHSRARNARVLLGVDGDGRYTALVEDDGGGFDAADSANPADSAARIGLSVMAQRAQSIGADLQIDSEPGEGARILLSFPRPAD
ncbi:MAG: histidine kinase [Gammaproteobacteria bacterium]|nr:histidine kinase [Gammaproteobacteria bacterium]